MDDNKRREIIESFAKATEKISPLTVGLESELEFPKTLIRLAIVEQFLHETDSDAKKWLRNGLILTDSFLPIDDFNIVKKLQANIHSMSNEERNSGDSLNHGSLNNLINGFQQEGEKFIQILKGIEEKGRKRIEQLNLLENIRSREQLTQLIEEIVKD